MAITQVFWGSADGSFRYGAIDNVAAPSFPVLSAGTHIGYDTVPGGAVAQATTALGAEITCSVPDFVSDQTSILNNPMSATIGFLNPS